MSSASPARNLMRVFAGLVLLAYAALLFASVFSGCAHAPTVGGLTNAAPLAFEIVHQKRIGMPGIDQGWMVDRRVGHIVNARTIPVFVTIDCDLSYWTPIKVDAAAVAGAPGELWFLLRPEDNTCVVSRVDPNDAIESGNSGAR